MNILSVVIGITYYTLTYQPPTQLGMASKGSELVAVRTGTMFD